MSKFTVGDLRAYLAGFDDSTELEFEGGLTFNYIKHRDTALILFNEIQAPLSDEFCAAHPDILVAFYKAPILEGPLTLIELPIL
ncbi:hypothetical protein HPO_19185 [Hyphomonas polymorpha PS728]|uniref:Uncharacterized protein n=1 Tax=Hyphomonas polymorpha PS728 TaxID=1280954 RepID=A0A062V8Y3_9PROT|nr:hypothetical protein [Hyphomonas polymorpha]KCZ96573.1 hypothetical protein HPO_19185 [Hyphomonas polymorpha PS728]